MERFDESLERPIDPILDAEYINMLGSLGLVHAEIDSHETPQHSQDSRWAVEPGD